MDILGLTIAVIGIVAGGGVYVWRVNRALTQINTLSVNHFPHMEASLRNIDEKLAVNATKFDLQTEVLQDIRGDQRELIGFLKAILKD